MVEHMLYIAIPLIVGSAFGYTVGGILRNRINAFIESKNDNPFITRINFTLIFGLTLSVGFVFMLWALLISIGGSFDQITVAASLPKAEVFSFIHLVGYTMGFLGLPGAFGFLLSQIKGDWDKKRSEEDNFRTYAAPQL